MVVSGRNRCEQVKNSLSAEAIGGAFADATEAPGWIEAGRESAMVDFARRRLTMVETQLRPNQVTDARLIAAMSALPRERFVPERLRGFAYIDEALEVFPAIDAAPPRFLLAPMVLARLVQLAAVEQSDAVLDVGCATGYSTALLARLGRDVTGIEPEPELAEAAHANLRALELGNVDIVEGALARGCPEKAPYDVILLNGSVPGEPASLFAQLKDGGRLAAILSRPGPGAQGKATLFVKAEGEVSGLPHFDAGAASLPGFFRESSFSF
jgi:protein-L-isoaspartate(D-aspartate) O-methyltransferase